MLKSPESCTSRREELPHRVHERMLGERFQKEGICPRFSCPIARGQDAEDEHGDIARQRIRLELTAEGEAVEHGDENLRDHNVRDGLSNLFQRSLSVVGERDGIAGLIQEMRLELADVRVTINDQDECLACFSHLVLVRHAPFIVPPDPKAAPRRPGKPGWRAWPRRLRGSKFTAHALSAWARRDTSAIA